MTADAAGRVIVTRRALERSSAFVVADALAVEPREVDVRLDDDRGRVAISIRTPVALPGDGLADALTHARHAALRRITDLTGAEVSRVSIRVTAWRPTASRRVE